MRRFILLLKLAAWAIPVLLTLPFHLVALEIGGRAAGIAPVIWRRVALFVLRVRVIVTGRPAEQRPLLLLSNHSSWLDIVVLGAILPLSFVSKKEVADWPFLGMLSKLERTVFIDRERRQATGAAAELVGRRLSEGDVIVLFAEGTSNDGNRVLPFRSALVGAAQKALVNSGTAWVQPVAIAYPRMLGLPVGRQHRPEVAWYGDLDLVPHLKNLLEKGGIDAQVIFGPARQLPAGADRKKVAEETGQLVRRLVAGLNAGRAPEALLAEAEAEPAAAEAVEAERV